MDREAKEKAKGKLRKLTKALIAFSVASVALLVALIAFVALSYSVKGADAAWISGVRDALCIVNIAFAFADLSTSAYVLGYSDALRLASGDEEG